MMQASRPFLICGLPRSRTAWLSNLLTYGPSHCWHDGLTTCRTLEDIRALMTVADFTGNADAGQVFFMDAIIRALGVVPRIVVIRRDRAEVLASCRRAHLPMTAEALEQMEAHLDTLVANHPQHAIEVGYDELSMENVRSIWTWCTHGELDFNGPRYQMLENFQVQLHPLAIQAGLETVRENITHLLEAQRELNREAPAA